MENSTNLKKGAHIHQPTAGSVPHACPQSYHAATGSPSSYFALIGARQRGKAVGLINGENPRLKNPVRPRCVQSSLSSKLHIAHVGAVGWEPHSSSTTTCAGKVDHDLRVNQNKGHTNTNPRPGHYLTHAHSHTTRAEAAMNSCFALTGAYQHGIAVGQ